MNKKEEHQFNFVVRAPISDANPILSLELENERSFAFAQRLKWIQTNKPICFFVSPHLDDAVYSAGSLLSFLAESTNVNIVTLFTNASHIATSEAAKRWLRISGHTDEEEHYRLRRIEDEEACRKIGVKPIHLGFIGTIWRRNDISSPMVDYETSFSIEDELLIAQAQERLKEAVISEEPYILFGPTALGGHIDHILTREVVKRAFHNTIFWLDFPYSQNRPVDEKALELEGLSMADWRGSNDKKIEGVLAYESQNMANFQNGTIPLPIERYYFSSSQHFSSSQRE